MTLLTFGKYAGLEDELILTRDINYCKYIHECPINDKTKIFKEWLNNNIQRGIEISNKKKQEALNKLLRC